MSAGRCVSNLCTPLPPGLPGVCPQLGGGEGVRLLECVSCKCPGPQMFSTKSRDLEGGGPEGTQQGGVDRQNVTEQKWHLGVKRHGTSKAMGVVARVGERTNI